ncbi:MAG: cytochrome c biogenesis CcdA family protein [Acidimicrobiales bacterium]
MDARLALAFSAGMVATVNPCGFALLPAYLSYFLGLEEAELGGPTSGGAPGRDRSGRDGPGRDGFVSVRRAPVMMALAVSAAVTAGFLVVFAVMGLVWSSVSGVVGERLPYVTVVIGIGLAVLGVAMLRGFEPIVRLPKLDLTRQGRELTSMFLYGISYAIASLSCTIAVFISIVSTTLDGANFGTNVVTFLAYGLGMGMTLSILTIAVALARTGIVRTFRGLLPHMNQISGVLLILAGAFVSYYAWVEIQELNSGTSSRVVQWTRDVQSSLQRWVEDVGGGRLAAAAAVIIIAAVVITLLLRRPNLDPSGGSDPAGPEANDQPVDQPVDRVG